MAYPTTAVFNPKSSSHLIGTQAILTTSTTQNHVLGTIAKAVDMGSAAAGEAEYIYLKGVASTAAGDVVVYDQKAGTTVRLVDDVSGGIGLVAVAMSACVASNYGWYCISGVVPVSAAATVVAGLPCYMAAAGQIDDDVVAGDLITGMFTQTTTTSSFAYCQLSRPYVLQSVAS